MSSRALDQPRDRREWSPPVLRRDRQRAAMRGVKLSLTSNGYTIERSSDETLKAFREVEVSIDFPTEAEQDGFRGRGNWKRVMAAIERARGLGVTVTVLTVMMKTNFGRLPEIAKVAFAAGAHYRVNVYQPVKTDAFTLTYEEYWDGFRRLLAAARLVSTTEPIPNAMLGEPFKNGSGCGRQTVRITPKGDIVPCVYWTKSDLRLEDLPAQGADGVLASPQFARGRQVPDVCRSCGIGLLGRSVSEYGRYVTVAGPTDGPPAPGGCLKLPMLHRGGGEGDLHHAAGGDDGDVRAGALDVGHAEAHRVLLGRHRPLDPVHHLVLEDDDRAVVADGRLHQSLGLVRGRRQG